MGASIVSCCHAPPVFQSAKHVFDFMSLFIPGFAISGWKVAALPRRNTGRYSFGLEGGTEFVAVITFVTNQTRSTVRQSRIEQLGSDMITHLAFTQAHDYRAAFAITYRM